MPPQFAASKSAILPATNAASSRGEALLRLAAAGDEARLAAMLTRYRAGEPAPYIAGFFLFRGHRFLSDSRAYITDPEATHLVETVNTQGRALAARLGRPLRVLEFGVGAATLAISVGLDNPTWSLAGIDLDPTALELARANADAHRVPLDLWPSDYLAGWPEGQPAPDLVFGDPPWGGEEDLYADADRHADYYHRMPALSAYPPGGGRCTIHDGLIRDFCTRRWPSLLILNYGVLPPELIQRSTAPLSEVTLVNPIPAMTILCGHV